MSDGHGNVVANAASKSPSLIDVYKGLCELPEAYQRALDAHINGVLGPINLKTSRPTGEDTMDSYARFIKLTGGYWNTKKGNGVPVNIAEFRDKMGTAPIDICESFVQCAVHAAACVARTKTWNPDLWKTVIAQEHLRLKAADQKAETAANSASAPRRVKGTACRPSMDHF